MVLPGVLEKLAQYMKIRKNVRSRESSSMLWDYCKQTYIPTPEFKMPVEIVHLTWVSKALTHPYLSVDAIRMIRLTYWPTAAVPVGPPL